MPGLIAAMVIALIWTYLAAILVEWSVIARILDNPLIGKALSSLVGTVAVLLIRGWLHASPGAYNLPPDALLYALAGGVIAVGRMILRGRSDLAVSENPDQVHQTLD